MTGKRLNSAEQERIENLTAEGLSPSKIGEQLDRSPHTIRKHVESPDTRTRIAGKLEVVIERSIDSITDEDYKKSSLVQKMTAAGIATDKLQLLTGQPTSIDVHYLLDAVQVAKDMRNAEDERLHALRRGPGPGSPTSPASPAMAALPFIEAIPPAEPEKAPQRTSQIPVKQEETKIRYTPIGEKDPEISPLAYGMDIK